MGRSGVARGYVQLTFEFRREESQWIGICHELGIGTYAAKTTEEAEEGLLALVTDHLNLLEEAGERERFFQEHGITFHSVIPSLSDFRLTSIERNINLGLERGASLFQPRVVEVRGPEAVGARA